MTFRTKDARLCLYFNVMLIFRMIAYERRIPELTSWLLLLVITIVMFLATILSNGVVGLDGRVGVLDHGEVWSQMDPVSGTIYWFGDMFCHQQEARSFAIAGSQMPFCVRETLLIIGTIIGLGLMLCKMSDPSRKMLTISLILSSITFLEWVIKAISGIDIIEITEVTAIISGIGVGLLAHEVVQRFALAIQQKIGPYWF